MDLRRTGLRPLFPRSQRAEASQASRSLHLDADSSDAALVQGCIAGKQLAWDLLLERYAPLIYSVPRRFELSEEDAADVFQNVCLALCRSLSSLHDYGSLTPWLIKVARNECVETISRQQRDRDHTVTQQESDDRLDALQADGPPLPDLIQQLEEEHKLRLAFAKLPERCQQLLRLLYFDPSAPSYGEIAAQLGLGPTAVGVNRARCLERLRRLLNEPET